MRTKKEIQTISIGKDYRIGLDGLNITVFWLSKARGKKQGGSWRPIAYLSSFKNALEFLVDRAVKAPDLKDLKAVVDKQDELYNLIEGLKTPPEFHRTSAPERVVSTPLTRKRRAGSKPLGKKKRGLKPAKNKRDIVSKKTIVEMLLKPKGKRGRRIGKKED